MFQVNKEVLQATINYLSTQPYAQVKELIAALQQSKPVEPQSPVPIKEDKNKKK